MVSAISTDTWLRTTLWRQLESGKDEDVKAALRRWLPDIEHILSQGGSTPQTYTLHDNGHSCRVAEWMVQIMPDDVLAALSSYELSLLLLSAYLHDVGMTPKGAKVQAVEEFLAGSAETSDDPDMKPFLEWFVANAGGIALPVQRVELVHELIARYVREVHNRWSAELIRELPMGHEPLGTYTRWLDDLIRLCQSHHWCYEDLKSEEFRARRVGFPPATVNLRYLAAVLRIADILDVDPRRSPEVLEKYRVIDESSIIFWEKDRGLSLEIFDHRVRAGAVPPNAAIHYAVNKTLDQIDSELRLCARLAEETHFDLDPPLVHHRWTLHSSVTRYISTPGTYVWMDGRFRPDERRMLQLLSSSGFHSDPLAPVVELMSNALDAVEEQMAYERLETGEARPHRVSMRFEKGNGRDWLVCADDGAGLTRELIENSLLVSGSVRSDIRILEWRCRNRGFALARTGTFGLGVLSYFSIADRLEIRTQRSPEAMRASQCDAGGLRILEAWHFRTAGPDSIGELHQDAGARVGAEVRLRLKTDVAVRIKDGLASEDARFLKERLVQPPCEFVFDAGDGSALLRFQPGAPPHPDVPAEFRDDMARYSRSSLSEEQLEPAAAVIERTLRWWPEEQGEQGYLPGGLGRYRIELPYFDLPGGASLGFLQAAETGGQIVVQPFLEGATTSFAETFVFLPRPQLITMWNGVRISATPPPTTDPMGYRATVSIDWRSNQAGQVTRSRVLALTQAGSESARWVAERTTALIRGFLNDNKDSVYSTLSAHIAGQPLPRNSRMYWISPRAVWDAQKGELTYPAGLKRTWAPVPFPVVTSDYTPPRYWRGRAVGTTSTLRPTRTFGLPGLGSGDRWDPHIICPDRLVFVPDLTSPPSDVTALWTGEQTGMFRAIGPAVLFPPAWQPLVHAAGVWNSQHPIVQAISAEDGAWFEQFTSRLRDPARCRPEALESSGRAATWLTQCLWHQPESLKKLAQEHAPFLADIWAALGLSGQPIACLFGKLLILTPTEFREIEIYDQSVEQVLGDPGEDWKLTTR